MAIRVVRLGSPRRPGEGARIGTVRRPPRAVPKAEYAALDYYDVWLPNLAPSVEAMKLARGAETERDWARFVRRYRAEMARPEASHVLELLAVLSRHASFSVGCYCEDESRCHRSILSALLEARGARMQAD